MSLSEHIILLLCHLAKLLTTLLSELLSELLTDLLNELQSAHACLLLVSLLSEACEICCEINVLLGYCRYKSGNGSMVMYWFSNQTAFVH